MTGNAKKRQGDTQAESGPKRKRRVSAAMYVRASDSQPQYSYEHQTEVIRAYAEEHGFRIVAEFGDRGPYNSHVGSHPDLGRLLAQVVRGRVTYRALLVYDVSRWGLFFETNESAHFEFLFRIARIAVHYCAPPSDRPTGEATAEVIRRCTAGELSRRPRGGARPPKPKEAS